MRECETRGVDACESPGEETQGAGSRARRLMGSWFSQYTPCCRRGQATSCFGPHRTVTWTEQGVQKDKTLSQ